MEKHFAFILTFLFSSIIFGQEITYNHLSSTSEILKDYLRNSGEFFTGENTELPYFQGKTDSKYIKFHKSTGVIVTFDFKTKSEYLSLIDDIQNKAEFRFKYCTDYDGNITYNYETYVGNKIRFNFNEMRISLEFPSELNTFLESNSEFTNVFVCVSEDAYAYHTNLKCSGLSNCEAKISKSNIKEAKKYKYKICEICTDDSYSKKLLTETLKNPESELMNENHNADVKVKEKEEKNFYDMMGYPKVTLNKNVRAYTLSIKNKKNGIDGELKTIEPNINNPHYISLTSNKDYGQLTIKNKDYKDIVIPFSKIYQGEHENGATTYYFVTENENYSIGYIDATNYNDTLIVELNQDSDNGIYIMYTISEI